MKSLALTPQGNSFIRKNHRFRYTETDLEYLSQKVRSVISIFLGEWFLDVTLGIPYIPEEDIKTGHRTMIETALRAKITAIKGIKRLTHFDTVYEPGDRTLFVDFQAKTDRGEPLEIHDTWPIPGPGGSE
jgi:hypothetical protein